MKNSSFPDASDSKYSQDEERHGHLPRGDRHDTERLRDPIDFDEESLTSCRQIVYMPTTPFARVVRPDNGEGEKENLIPLASPNHLNRSTTYQSNHDEYVIQPHVADDHCSRKHAKSDSNEGDRECNPGEGENTWCSVLIATCGRFKERHFWDA